MHKSKLAGYIIDCKGGDLKKAAHFWSNALGMKQEEYDSEVKSKYIPLIDGQNGLNVEVQSVDHESRVHLDIETDDLDAEVLRLEKLGAYVINKLPRWYVMEAPTGHRFCVVNKASKDFDLNANQWT